MVHRGAPSSPLGPASVLGTAKLGVGGTQGLGETAWEHEVCGRGPGGPSRPAPVEPGVRTVLWDAALGLAEGQRGGAPVPPTPALGAPAGLGLFPMAPCK